MFHRDMLIKCNGSIFVEFLCNRQGRGQVKYLMHAVAIQVHIILAKQEYR